ncbi:hypothetical protein D9M70_226500 [compost metagenome]
MPANQSMAIVPTLPRRWDAERPGMGSHAGTWEPWRDYFFACSARVTRVCIS